MRAVNGTRRAGSGMDSTDRMFTGVGPGEVTLKTGPEQREGCLIIHGLN